MNSYRVICHLGVVFLLIMAGVGPVANATAATPKEENCRSPVQDIPLGHGVSVPASQAEVNATVTRVNESAIRFTYHDLDSNESNFGPGLPTWFYELGIRVVATDGFQIDRSKAGAALIWNSSVPNPSVIFTAETPQRGVFDSAGAAIQPKWAFIPIPAHSHPTNVTLGKEQPGYVGDQVLLLGEYSVYKRSVGCHDIELYIPESLTTAESPKEIADSLEVAARNLDVGWRYETVRVFGVGSPVRLGGRAFTHEVWVNVNSTFEPNSTDGVRYPPRLVPANIWVHEYVHTRQRWVSNTTISKDAYWLTEAIASYYMVAETERQGRMLAYNESVYWMRLNQSLRLGHNRINLTEISTYRRNQGDYTRGAFILAALNHRIKTSTNGRKSIEDVFRRLNQQDEVNHSSFRQAVIKVGGEDLGPWVDNYVAGTAVPPAPDVPYEVYWELTLRRPKYQAMGGIILFSVLVSMLAIRNRWRKSDS